MKSTDKLHTELSSFRDLWHGGYYSGDPLDPFCSIQSVFGYCGMAHVVYLVCIKPFLAEDSVVLEIGPGRGSWTRTMKKAREVWCLDALSAEHNGFWEYVGRAPQIKYHQVADFSCRMLPDDTFTYMFSYGALCHVSVEGITAYLRNLYPKLRYGAHGMIMVADYQKFNSAISHLEDISILNRLIPMRRMRVFRLVFGGIASLMNGLYARKNRLHKMDVNEDDEPRPGRWYDAGLDRTCNLLTDLGYTVIDPDMGVDRLSPMIHFAK